MNPNAVDDRWPNVDTDTDLNRNGSTPAGRARGKRRSTSPALAMAEPGAVIVTGSPPGDARPVTPISPSTNEAGVPALRKSTTAEPADGHAGAAGATHRGIRGTTGGSYGDGVVGTGNSAGAPSAANTGTGGKPTVRPATNDNTKAEHENRRDRRTVPP